MHGSTDGDDTRGNGWFKRLTKYQGLICLTALCGTDPETTDPQRQQPSNILQIGDAQPTVYFRVIVFFVMQSDIYN